MTGHTLLAAVLVSVSSVFWALEQSVYSWGFGGHYIAVSLLVAWYFRSLLRDNLAATMTSFYQIFYGVGMLVSATIIASGVEMIEISRVGDANGVFWLMLGFFVIGIEATVFGYRAGNAIHLPARALRLPEGVSRTIIVAMLFPALFLSIYVFLATGGPLLRGVDRVTFWRNIAPTGTAILPSLITQTFFFVAFLYLRKAKKCRMWMVRFLLIAYLLSAVLVLGQKFSVFITFLNMWLMVTIGVMPEFRFRMHHLAAIALVMALLLLIVALTYTSGGSGASFILIRAALQAQLLWSIAEESLQGVMPPFRPDCYFACDGSVSGMDYISYRYLPSGLYDFYKDNGTVMSGFMPALPILTFGPVVPVCLHVFVGLMSGILQRKITIALGKNQPIYGFLLFKLHFGVTLVWFAALQTAIFGLLTVIAAIVIYRMAGILQKGSDAALVSG